MKIFDLIGMGFKNLWRRKLRTFLTVLGVLIGATSIVVMLSLGIALNIETDKQIKQMGGLNKIEVRPDWEKFEAKNNNNKGEWIEPYISDKEIEKIRKLDNVKAVAPSFEVSGRLVSNKYLSYGRICGVYPEAMEIFGFEVEKGRLLNDDDTLGIVIGKMATQRFYDPKLRNKRRRSRSQEKQIQIDPLKDPLMFTFDSSYGREDQKGKKRPKLYKLDPIGILKSGDYERDYGIYMNIEYLKKIKEQYDREVARESKERKSSKPKESGYQEAKVFVEDIKKIDEVTKQLEKLGLQSYSMTEYLEPIKKQAATVQAILGGIGAISLIVAAIGITNTMVMSIYERTREIGVMKVIGARLKDIKRIFLFEAGMIGFIGGVVSIGLSYGLSYLLNQFGGDFMGGMVGGGMMMRGNAEEEGAKMAISVIPMWLAFSALGFSTLVGLVSGFWPAVRAMKLSALEAIKTE